MSKKTNEERLVKDSVKPMVSVEDKEYQDSILFDKFRLFFKEEGASLLIDAFDCASEEKTKKRLIPYRKNLHFLNYVCVGLSTAVFILYMLYVFK